MRIRRQWPLAPALWLLACSSKEPVNPAHTGAGAGGQGATSGTTSAGGRGNAGDGSPGGSSSGGAAGAGVGGNGGRGGRANGGASSGGTAGGAGVDDGGSAAGGTGGVGGVGGVGGASIAGSAGAAGVAGVAGVAGGGGVPTFTTRTLAMDHVAEGADVGDIDGDGVIDLIAGPRWYKGPDFSLGGTIIPDPPTFKSDQYSTFFLTFVDDISGDGYPDVIAIGDAGGGNGTGTPNAFWYENPGPQALTSPWTKRALYDGLVSNESPAYANVVGDAKRELVFMTDRTAGFAERPADPTEPWTYTAVTPGDFNTPYVHGLGVGDIDGDGMSDIVERTGWWRQTGGMEWERHAFSFGMAPPSNWGGAQMQVFDVDGDGDNDVVTALAAHGYGISWFEREGSGESSSFAAHSILPTTPGGDNFSQAHALVAADVNGDGLTDLIAGKRYYAHPSSNPDPGTTDPPVLYWFELQRAAAGPSFVPHLVHADSGAGCNFVARDLTGDGKVDIFTTNKRGTFLHVQN